MKSLGPLLPLDDALALVRARCSPLPAEEVAFADAHGRTLAAPVVAPRDLPAFDLSMMDGYAVRVDELESRVVLTVKAGDAPPARALGALEAARIFTGAPLPPGAEAVVLQEHVQRDGDRLTLPSLPKPGQHIRRRGEEVRAGAQVLPAGARLWPAELSLVAGLGGARVRVHGRPRVALLATGDELVAAGQEPGPGQLVETNGLSLGQACRDAGAEVLALGIAGDDPRGIADRLASVDADVLVTTGGASVGDHDHAQASLELLGGALVFHALAIRPGKPILFGTAGTTRAGRPRLFVGLPGNPAASLLGCELVVRLIVRLLSGDPHPDRTLARCVLRERPLSRVPGLEFFPRGRATVAEGRLWFTPLAQQSSMQLGSWVGVNAVARLPPGTGVIAPGEAVDVLLVGPL